MPLPFILPNYSDTNPPAPPGRKNLKWQKGPNYPAPDGSGNTWADVSESSDNLGDVDARTTTVETISLASQGKLVTFSNAAAIEVGLDSAGVAAGFMCWVQNLGAGLATLTPSIGTIDGGANLMLTQNQGVGLFFDGTNWEAMRGMGSGGGDSILSKAIDGTVPSDGEILQYSSATGKWELVVDRPIFPVSALPGKPSAGQLVCIYTAAASMVFPPNFATPNSYGSAGTSPTASAIYAVFKNGVQVGTVTISTAGVFTFATTGGTSFSLNAGDRLTVVAPGTQDTTLADVGITLVGTRTATVPSGTVAPVFTWRGTYSGAATYQPFDVTAFVVSGKVQSYVCIATTTGNAPTNTSFWNLLAQAGGDGTTSAAQIQQEAFTYAADTGTANAYAVSLSPAPTLVAGSVVVFKATNANTGASTLAVNGGTAVAIRKNGSTALSGGEIAAGQIVAVVYDATNFQLIGGGGGGDTTAKYIIGAGDAALSNALVWPGLYNSPDAPPSSPGSLDDEFDGATLNTTTRWTWHNQSTATATLAKSILKLLAPKVQGERIIYQASPATPWEVTAKLCVIGLVDGQNCWAGLSVQDSGSTSLVDFQWYPFVNGLNVMHLSSDTGFVSNPKSVAMFGGAVPPWIYLRIGDDGTNLYCKYALDGLNFTQIYHEARKSFLTVNGPDRVGIVVDNWSALADDNGDSIPILCADFFRRTI